MLPVANNMLPRKRQVLARFSVSALVASLPLLYVSLLRPPQAALAGNTAFWFLMSNCVVAAIVAADDAGTLFFGSSKTDDNISYAVSGGLPAAAFEEPSTMTSSNSVVDGALPFLVHGERDEVEVAATKPCTGDLNKNNVTFKGQGGEAMGRPSSASSADDPAIIETDRALSGPEPDPGLVEEVQEEEEIPEAWAREQHSRTPDLQQGKGAGEGKLRRSATEGSKPAAAEDSEYWELSDEELNRRVEEFIARFNREMRRQVEQEAGV